jgi:hypothetical protein
MRYVFAIIILALIIAPLSAGAAATTTSFWNPFRGVQRTVFADLTGFLELIKDTFPRLFAAISQYRAVSPTFLGYKFAQGLIKVPSPIPGEGREPFSVPCGGGDADPFWADDCSCHCSTGGLPNVTYQASGRCPDNPELECEHPDCRHIARHDKHVTSVAECREEFNRDHF